jgi:hypothetical protein
MLTPAYPKRLFGDDRDPGERVSATRPLLMSSGGRVMLIIFIVVGILNYGADIGVRSTGGNDNDTTSAAQSVSQ